MSKDMSGTQTTNRFLNSAVLASMAVLSLNSPEAIFSSDAVRKASERTHALYSLQGSIDPTFAHNVFSIQQNPEVEQVITNTYQNLIASQKRASSNIETIVFANLWDLYD